MFSKLFVDHPRDAGESYLEHMGMAWSFGGRMFVASLACFIHGLIPGLCIRTGSKSICELHEEMSARAKVCEDAKATTDRPMAS